jgi:hypothetical protein
VPYFLFSQLGILPFFFAATAHCLLVGWTFLFLLRGAKSWKKKGTHHDLLLSVNDDLALLAVGTDKDLET